MAHAMHSSFDNDGSNNAIPMFSKSGTALSEQERERIAQKRGQCLHCGIKTKESGVFKQKALTSEHVYKGICIRCNPEKIPSAVYEEWAAKFRPAATKSSPVAKFRAAARATAFAAQLSPSHTLGKPAAASGSRNAAVRPGTLLASTRQTASQSSRHTSSLPPAAGRGRFEHGSMSMSALHASAPAAAGRPQFDQTTGSFRYSDTNSERSQLQFDGNMSLGALKLSESSSRRQFDGSLSMSNVRDGIGSSERFSSQSGGMTMSDRSSSHPIPEEEEEEREQSSRDLLRRTKESGGKSSSWMNYSHEAGNASASSFAASDYSGGESATEDFDQLIVSLKENLKNPEVLKQKLHRLRNLAEYEGDTVTVLRDILNEYRNDSEVLTAAVGALWSVTAENDDKKIEAAESGAIDCILDSLRNSQTQEDFEFDEWSIGLLACLARAQGNREKIGKSHGVETILDTLRLYQAYAGVFEWSCRALHALVHQYEDEENDGNDTLIRNMTSIDENDGVAVIVSAMKLHYSEPIAQNWALVLLLRLMDREDAAAVNHFLGQVNKADGIGACVKVLKARSTTPQVHCLAAEVLACLVVEAEAADNSAALQSAVECASSVLRVMKDNDGDENVQESCCRLFAKLARIEKGRLQIKDTKALNDIIYAMMKYTSNLLLHEAGSWTLWTMSSYPTVFSMSYAKDALSALKASTKEFPDAALLLVGACGFIANVSSTSEAKMSHVPVEIPIRALKLKDPTDMVDEQACRALTSICIRIPSKVGVVFEGGGVDALVKRLGSESLKASAAACKSLAAMANTNDEIRRSIIDAGALDASLTLLGSLRSTECMDETLELISVLLAWQKKRQSVKIPNDSVSAILERLDSCSHAPPLLVKACDSILNVLLATGTGSKSLELDGLIEAMIALLNDRNYPVQAKQSACAVLWALVTKQKTKNEDQLTSMFRSVAAVMKTYKGEDEAFNSDLQSSAAGALACISARLHDSPFSVDSNDVDGIISVIYATLEYDRERTELLEKLLNVLLNVSLANEALVIKCGGIVVVIDVMSDNEQVESLLEVGCSILGLLASTEDLQVNLCIAETDGIDTIISALASFPSNERIQVASCKALSHLSGDSESRQLIVSQGGLMLIVNAINSNRENYELLEGALLSLCHLASDTDEQILSGSNMLETVIQAMRYNEDVPKVVEKGLGVLQHLSMRGTEAKREIARLGGIKILIEAIGAFLGEANVLERAFTTMWSLALLDSNQKLIAKAGGVELVLNGMMAQLGAAAVQQQACGCLCTLATDSRNNALIREADGVDAIIYAIWTHYDSEDVLSEACRALSNVVVDKNTNQCLIAQVDEVSSVISAMRCFPQSSKVQQNACMALQSLLSASESVDATRSLSSEIKAMVTAAANKFPEECSVSANHVLHSIR